ncbi:hypothetical protein ACI7BZ_02440 [Xanthobacter sp. AM11]|uniref:hypothetical protein n=1 Tax=Xanthobacter sp. AM11 TaxID=3380643 RepID=UPI0039BF1969
MSRSRSAGGERRAVLSRRLLLGGAAAVLLPATVVRAQEAPAAPVDRGPVDATALRLLASLPGKVIMGAKAAPLVTEFVDFNAPGWRHSADDMRQLLFGDPRLAYAVVQMPRRDVQSVEAARIALAVLALHPGRFQAFYEALSRTEGQIDGVKALNVVRAEGLDHFKIFRASNQPDVTDSLNRSVELGSALRLIEPPAYVIGANLWTGDLDLARKRALITAARG